jgi:hypothetical protein
LPPSPFRSAAAKWLSQDLRASHSPQGGTKPPILLAAIAGTNTALAITYQHNRWGVVPASGYWEPYPLADLTEDLLDGLLAPIPPWPPSLLATLAHLSKERKPTP